MSFGRTIDPRVNALLDPVLETLGLLVHGPTGDRVRVPLALLASPRAWLENPRALGSADDRFDPDRFVALFDSLGHLLGIGGPALGMLSFPGAITIAAERTAEGAARIVLGAAGAPGGGLRLSGTVDLRLPQASSPTQFALNAAIALDGVAPMESSSRLVATVGPGGAELRLVFASGGGITLLPAGPGLGAAAATAAATYALPLALDAIVGIGGVIGDGLGDLGDALALRSGGKFDGDALMAFAEDPAAQLASRLNADAGPAYVALASLIDETLPAGWSTSGASSTFTLSKAGVLTLTVTSPASNQVAVAVVAEPIEIMPGTTIDGEMRITTAGLQRARARFRVDPATPLVAGPVRFAPGIEVDTGPEAVDGDHLAVWLGATSGVRLEGRVPFGPPTGFELHAPGAASLALGAVQVLMPVAMDVALSTGELQAVLGTRVLDSGGQPAIELRALLEGVLLHTVNGVSSFDAGVLDPDKLLPRTLVLAKNLAGQAPVLDIDPLTVRFGPAVGDAELFGITVSLVNGKRFELVGGDVQLALEVDSTWIQPPGDGGLRVDLLRIHGGVVTLEPGVAIRGLGLRLMRASAPLLDALLTIGSLALHGYLELGASGVSAGGGQLELGGFALPLGGGDGGDKVASGILADAATGKERPNAEFSPALSLQSGPPPHGLRIGFRAGQDEGPWWIGIRRSFGPVYLEQIGIGVEQGEDRPNSISVMVDGKVSMLGLTVAVDDLSLTADWGGPLYLPSSWSVSLAGLAVGADMGGVKIAGGLRRGSGAPDYLGMLTVR
ncbi:MAG: hypothetical protein OEV72_13825, partial [Thermoleophilia bacterium]|nr:hypothetical protein [Thermoleophilia bacterium]